MDRAILLAARILMEGGRPEEAMRLLAIVPAAAGTTSNINSDHAVALLMAELALKQGNLNEAERHLACIKGGMTSQQHQALQQQLTSMKPLLRAAESALAEGAWQTARQQAEGCLGIIQSSSMPGLAVRLLLIQAAAAHQLEDYENAIKALDLALQLQPDCKPALWERAAAHTAAGRYQVGFLDLRRLSTLQPDYPGLRDAMQQAARVCSEQRRATVQAATPQKCYSRVNRSSYCQPAGGNGMMHDSRQARHQLYRVLGLASDAGTEQVKKAYKQLAAKLHPDKQAGASQEERVAAEEQFKVVSAAYHALMGHLL